MTVVVDVGAARYDDVFSMERLVDEFHPSHLYGYDPNPSLALPDLDGTKIKLTCAAAWTHTGTVGYLESGAWSYLSDDPARPQVPCVDLADEIRRLAKKHRRSLILKLDCEGAEYVLLPHLIAAGVDELLELVWVEWHPFDHPGAPFSQADYAKIRAEVEASVRCEMREWWF